jgi:predicted molibdopterin-dependent oxidoreductase YjgC
MTVSLTINGTAVKAKPGMTVLEAAQANDIYIPTLCYAPKLRPVGACRICVVEIEKMRGFPSACTVPATEGMVVHTETEDVQDLRRETLSLILSEHPYTCLVCQAKCGDYHSGTIRKAAVTTGCQYCPSNGQCELQELIEYLKIEDIPYPITYRGLPVEQEDPFFDRDYNLCILCGRCIRACQEVRHNGVLAFVNRGNQTIVGTAFNRSHLETDCQFCGVCVDVCPTGALADKRGKWEGVPETTVSSVCPYCSVGCAINIQVKEGKAIRAIGHDDGPANDGQLCVRGRFGMVDVIYNLTRLKAPLVRRNGRLVEVSWDEALKAAQQGLNQYKGDQFALIASAVATTETGYAWQKFARTVMHSNNVALAADFPANGHVDKLIETLKGIDGPAIRDVREAGCILTIGANVFESHPILGLEIHHALSRGASLITIDPRQTGMARQSDVWLQPKVGTDHVLLTGMLKLGSGDSAEFVEDVDLNRVIEVTGIKAESIARAVDRLTDRSPVVIIYGSGVTHHPTAPAVIKAIRGLAAWLGDAEIMVVPGEGNFVGAYDMGVHPALLPGYRPLSNSEARSTFETAWNTTLKPTPGRNFEAILDGIRQGEIKALYLAGEVPPMAELADLDFLVVQDILTTDNIINHADVVLPTTTFAEMDGTLTNLEGRVQRLRRAIAPVGLSRPGWMIVRDVAQYMTEPEDDRRAQEWEYQSAAEVMAEIAALVPAYAGASDPSFNGGGVLRRFEPVAEVEISPLSLDGVPQFTSDEFPLTLITERNLHYYHGACLTEEVKGMNLIKQEEVLHLNPTDAKRLGIADGDLVKAVSPYGSAECIVEISNGLSEGTSFASFNRVTGSALFLTANPVSKACAIRIETSQ